MTGNPVMKDLPFGGSVPKALLPAFLQGLGTLRPILGWAGGDWGPPGDLDMDLCLSLTPAQAS